MNTHGTIRAAALVALVATPFAIAPAAGPFQVRRATSAQLVSTAPPLATIATLSRSFMEMVKGVMAFV